ncbi:MAG TPA: peptidoglycan bridge formation glycyltransferase FemA/FemB family protein [Patescibacteria group bacterium]|jgi:lipid II:glycine glycyltransferase (peptidoglycan interpeptide bridge formation enzyme)|nr:peptidoglycan bridge formation glycyltransferase FemA/FemB family protein [Patescibacteria group bacterium]
MKTLRLTDEHKNEYEMFVAAHDSGSFLQSWSWGKFQTAQEKVAIRYGAFEADDNGAQKLIATAQFLQTKIPHLPGMYLYAPYGPLISKGQPPVVAHEFIGKIKSDFAKAWFIRLEPKDETPIDGKPSLHIQPGSTLITDLALNDQELLAQMHQKTRYNIRVAEKHGVVVSSGTAAVAEAIALLAKTSERQGYKSYSESYYKELIEFFANKTGADCSVKLYQAVHEGAPIAVAIMIDHGSTRTYLFGGSDNEKRNLMAPYALHWQAIKDAKEAGLTKYDWWGAETASGETPGFVQFKMRWGGTQKFYANARDIVLHTKLYRAYTALRKVNRFF